MIQAKSPLLLSVMLAGLAACSSTPVAPPAPVPVAALAPATVQAPVAAAGAGTPGQVAGANMAASSLPAYLDPNSPISTLRSVYFDYDEYTLSSDDTPVVERHGRYLASNPGVSVRIEGNTDERGGTEYNLALGQKRAEAVLKALRIYGVKAEQLEAVSWGEDRPRAQGTGEAAMAQNRRADLQYPRR